MVTYTSLRQKILFLFSILIFWGLGEKGFSQVITPVQANLMWQAPYSVYLADLTAPGSNNLKLALTFNDFNEPSYDVRLRISIEGNGISLATDENFNPPPITLLPGINNFMGAELEEYFLLDNLTLTGIDEATLRQTGALPSGTYALCVQVFDFRRNNVALSDPSCATSMLVRNDPPIIVGPACESIYVPKNSLENILFQWQDRSGNGVQASYELTVVQVLPGTSPLDALNGAGTPLLDREPVMTTSFTYGPEQVPLQMGQRYAWEVRALDPMGQTTFENDGRSVPCWFDYGIQGGGTIALTFPPDEQTINTKFGVNFEWEGPSNKNELTTLDVTYLLRVVEWDGVQDKNDAMLSGAVVVNEQTEPVGHLFNYTLAIRSDFPLDRSFVWQVKAFVDEQEAAASEVQTFTSNPLLHQFIAGEHTVKVKTITNGDLNNFSGSGSFALMEDGTEVDVEFQDLKLATLPGDRFALQDGTIDSPVEDVRIDLDNGDNGTTYFGVDRLTLSNTRLGLTGRVKWEFPLATTQTEGQAIVQSESKNVSYVNFKINRTFNVEEVNFDLADPFGYNLKYESTSSFEVTNNVVSMSLNGQAKLPGNVKTSGGERPVFQFNGADNPFFFRLNSSGGAGDIKVLPKMKMFLSPSEAICDFSEDQSPEKLSGDAGWKGVYFEQFRLRFESGFDENGQITENVTFDPSFSLTDNYVEKAWVESQGLVLKLSHQFPEGNAPIASFNSFSDDITEFTLDFVHGSVTESELKGFVLIPFFSQTEQFTYTLPIDDNGLQNGFLDEDLVSRQIVFNPNVEDQKVIITIQRAVFMENERLETTIDLEWPSLNLSITNLEDFIIWGNGTIGFGTPNGSKALTNQASAKYYDAFNVTIDEVRAGFGNGKYAFGLHGNMPIGGIDAGIVDQNGGAPEVSFASLADAGGALGSAPHSTGGDDWVKKFDENQLFEPEEKERNNIQLKVELKKGPVQGKVDLIIMIDDPDWGDGFYGHIEATLQQMKIDVDGTLLIGKKEPDWYFFVEVGVAVNADPPQDVPGLTGETVKKVSKPVKGAGSKLKKAQGIKIGPYVEIIGVAGRIYHHMSPSNALGIFGDCGLGGDSGNSGNATTVGGNINGLGGAALSIGDVVPDINYEVNPGVVFGAMLMVTLQDVPSSGFYIRGSGAVEVNFNEGGSFREIRIQLDATMANEGDEYLGRGVGCATYNFNDETFLGSLAWEGGSTVCGHGVMQLKITSNDYEFLIGTRENPIDLRVGCSGPGMAGWLVIKKDTIGIGLGPNFQTNVESPEIDIKVCTFTAGIEFKTSITAFAMFQTKPLRVISAGVDFNASLDIYVDYDCGVLGEDRFDLLAISLEGNVTYYFQTGQLTGTVTGEIKILGGLIDEETEFDVDINVNDTDA